MDEEVAADRRRLVHQLEKAPVIRQAQLGKSTPLEPPHAQDNLVRVPVAVEPEAEQLAIRAAGEDKDAVGFDGETTDVQVSP
jgi:hypothetical protein